MGSSFISQVPVIIDLIKQLKPLSVIDIGKGFGKYGFLIHEYYGIDNSKKINSDKNLKEQSFVQIDAVEVDADFMLPHLNHLYNHVYFADIFDIYLDLSKYDLVLMIDVIEHLEKKMALELIAHFLKQDSKIIVATPIDFFNQDLYQSEYEHHISHWTYNDFKLLGFVDVQKNEAGAIYLISNNKLDIRGFGLGLIKKLRRIARSIRNELPTIF